MAYKDIIQKLKRDDREKFVPVFSEIIGETNREGKLADFIRLNESLLTEYRTGPQRTRFSKEIELLRDYRRLFKTQSEINTLWLTMMGLLEIKILQIHCLLRPKIAYSVQVQKSGENKFNYILLRTPFYSVLQGKKELRVYYNKLEDYPKYKSLKDLMKDQDFLVESEEAIRKVIRSEMDKDDVTIQQFMDNFQESEKERERLTKDWKHWLKTKKDKEIEHDLE